MRDADIVTLRLPEEAAKAVRDLAEETGLSRTALCRQAVLEFLGMTPGHASMQVRTLRPHRSGMMTRDLSVKERTQEIVEAITAA